MKYFPISESALSWLSIILSERFGNRWQLCKNKEQIEMKLFGFDGAIIFPNLSLSLTEANSNQPYTNWDSSKEGWNPVLGHLLPAPGFNNLIIPLIEKIENNYHVKYDILGLTYWMLGRIEEIYRTDLDEHERFPASSSHAFKYGYIERPIVDEWMHILGQVIKRQWPQVKLRKHKYQTVVSCDVDHPFEYSGNKINIIRRFAGDLIKRKSLIRAFQNLVGELCVFLGYWKIDSNFRGLDFIMNQCEEKNLSALFFFITYKTDKNFDVDAGINKNVSELINLIHQRGHKVGIHPGYNAYKSSKLIKKSYELLLKIFHQNGINQKTIGSRQHYLRWETPKTQSILQENNISFDTTLGYADFAGFRCGTCHQYSMFDPVEQKQMSLKQKPLIAMESSVFDKKYMNMDQCTGLEYILKIKDFCEKVDGSFVFLWHNSSFIKKNDNVLFSQIIG